MPIFWILVTLPMILILALAYLADFASVDGQTEGVFVYLMSATLVFTAHSLLTLLLIGFHWLRWGPQVVIGPRTGNDVLDEMDEFSPQD